jgi:tetratricopeptide (TPR) repeat protein
MRSKGIVIAGATIAAVAAVFAGMVLAQSYDPGVELALVEKLVKARDDYRATLNELYNYYLRTGDAAKSRRAERELRAFNGIEQYDFAKGPVGEVPKEPIKVLKYVPEADDYYTDGMIFAGSNRKVQRDLALKRFEKILGEWPDSDKAPVAAFAMGEIYSGLYFWDYDLASKYYMNAYELDPATSLPALLKAGDMYYKVERYDEATKVYKLAVQGSVDPKVRDKAQAQLDKLAGMGK